MQLTINIPESDIYAMLEKMGTEDKIKIMKRLEAETIVPRLRELKAKIIPPAELSEDDVLQEIKAQRMGA